MNGTARAIVILDSDEEDDDDRSVSKYPLPPKRLSPKSVPAEPQEARFIDLTDDANQSPKEKDADVRSRKHSRVSSSSSFQSRQRPRVMPSSAEHSLPDPRLWKADSPPRQSSKVKGSNGLASSNLSPRRSVVTSSDHTKHRSQVQPDRGVPSSSKQHRENRPSPKSSRGYLVLSKRPLSIPSLLGTKDTSDVPKKLPDSHNNSLRKTVRSPRVARATNLLNEDDEEEAGRDNGLFSRPQLINGVRSTRSPQFHEAALPISKPRQGNESQQPKQVNIPPALQNSHPRENPILSSERTAITQQRAAFSDLSSPEDDTMGQNSSRNVISRSLTMLSKEREPTDTDDSIKSATCNVPRITNTTNNTSASKTSTGQNKRPEPASRAQAVQSNGAPKRTSLNGRMSPDTVQSPIVSNRNKLSLSAQPNLGENSISLDDLEDLIRSFDRNIKDEVALTARCLLHDVQRVNQSVPPSRFIDKSSPWGGLKSVELKSDELGNAGATMPIEKRIVEKTNNHNSKVKAAVKSTLSVKTIRNTMPSVPAYTAITLVKRSFLTADDDVLRYVPYFADNDYSDTTKSHKTLVKELEDSYMNLGLTTRESELAGQIREHFGKWLPRVDLSETDLQRYLLDHEIEDFKMQKDVLRSILKSLGGPLSEETLKRARDFVKTFKLVFAVEVSDVVLPLARLREMGKSLRPPDENDLQQQKTFSTFAQWMCLICGVPYCQVHGDYSYNPVYHLGDESTVAKNEGECQYDYQPLGLSMPDFLRNSREVLDEDEDMDSEHETLDFPCSKDCYSTFRHIQEEYPEWPVGTCKSFEEFAHIFVDKTTRSCNISLGVEMPCWQVHQELEKLDVRPSNREDESKSTRKVLDRPSWYNNERKTLHAQWEDMTNAHSHEERTQLNTCAHEGPCNSGNCSCHSNNILCERWCLCSADCGRRFTGCSCASNGVCCVQESCICIQMNRECGPECASCGAVERLNPRNKYNDVLFKTGCQNIALQRGVPKRLAIGESTLEGVGFGAFLVEPARKGDYLGQYVGEMITFKESERRAIIYERKHSSFLFDVNSEWTVDAARHGNKTRFINHAPTESKGLNCGVKVLFANGEHRIKFLALRDIKAGEEVFFNYGIKFTESHLREKLETVSSGKKGSGALTGREALDALDGLDAVGKNARKKIAARKKGKARKTAGPKEDGGKKAAVRVEPTVVERESEEDLEAEEEVEDSDSEDDSEGDEPGTSTKGRPKRSIKKPKRYTR